MKMQLIRDINSHCKPVSGCVLTMGNFDGVHLGHQRLIHQLLNKSQQLSLPAVLMSFEPQPIEFFKGKENSTRLMRFREKWLVLSDYSINYFYCARFNSAFARLTPQQFVQRILVDGLSVKHVIIGDDFHFGAERLGDYSQLKKLGMQFQFDVTVVKTIKQQGKRISSSWLRQALIEGNMKRVCQLLGRPYCLVGKVLTGDQRGRQFGFPTINLSLYRKVAPVTGIYAVKVRGLSKDYLGVASVGYRPAYRVVKPILEVYLLDFNQMIYGQLVQIEFMHKIRDEMNFSDDAALIAQIKNDVEQARDFFDKM